jgi:hypothetical protein
MNDLRITGADPDLTHRTTGDLYDVYFTLSKEPDRVWIDAFEASRRLPRHEKWRHMWITGRHIVVQCELDEAKMHLRDLKQDVENANDAHRADAMRLKKLHDTYAEKDEREREDVLEALGKLQFDDE